MKVAYCIIHSTKNRNPHLRLHQPLQCKELDKQQLLLIIKCFQINCFLASVDLSFLITDYRDLVTYFWEKKNRFSCYTSTSPRYHHHHQFHVADEGRRVVAPPCPRSTAHLQRSPIGRVESFHLDMVMVNSKYFCKSYFIH